MLPSSTFAEQIVMRVSIKNNTAFARAHAAQAVARLRRVHCGMKRHDWSVRPPQAAKRIPPFADHQASMYTSAAADTNSPIKVHWNIISASTDT